jgi:hypothetical protein
MAEPVEPNYISGQLIAANVRLNHRGQNVTAASNAFLDAMGQGLPRATLDFFKRTYHISLYSYNHQRRLVQRMIISEEGRWGFNQEFLIMMANEMATIEQIQAALRAQLNGLIQDVESFVVHPLPDHLDGGPGLATGWPVVIEVGAYAEAYETDADGWAPNWLAAPPQTATLIHTAPVASD